MAKRPIGPRPSEVPSNPCLAPSAQALRLRSGRRGAWRGCDRRTFAETQDYVRRSPDKSVRTARCDLPKPAPWNPRPTGRRLRCSASTPTPVRYRSINGRNLGSASAARDGVVSRLCDPNWRMISLTRSRGWQGRAQPGKRPNVARPHAVSVFVRSLLCGKNGSTRKLREHRDFTEWLLRLRLNGINPLPPCCWRAPRQIQALV